MGNAPISARDASYMAAEYINRPDLGDELARVAVREGRYADGPHPKDAWASPHVYRQAVARGWVDPECYWEGHEDWNWSTRGKHGLMAAFSLRFLPEWTCPLPSVLDHPGPSALAAARRADQCRTNPWWSRRLQPCKCEDRAANWVGVGRWKVIPNWKRWRSVKRQCKRAPSVLHVLRWVSGDAVRWPGRTWRQITRWITGDFREGIRFWVHRL